MIFIVLIKRHAFILISIVKLYSFCMHKSRRQKSIYQCYCQIHLWRKLCWGLSDIFWNITFDDVNWRDSSNFLKGLFFFLLYNIKYSFAIEKNEWVRIFIQQYYAVYILRKRNKCISMMVFSFYTDHLYLVRAKTIY